MKALALLASVIVTLTGCNCQKTATEKNDMTANTTVQERAIPTLEYEANTRGFYRKITISDKKAWVIPTRDAQAVEVAITEADWKELTGLYQSVDQENLPNLKDPTQKRFYDGAPIAHFRILTQDKTFETVAFDGGYPPAEIERIVNKIIAIGDKVE